MDEKIYTITLADGTILKNLKLNGNNYIAPSLIDDSVFDGNLDTVTISDGKTTEVYKGMILIQNTTYGDGKSWFILAEKLSGVIYEPVTLSDVKTEQIALSKGFLAEYLESHPLTSSAHGGEEARYSATIEKNNLLTAAIMMAQGAVAMGVPYDITWNASGQPCEPWTLPELMQLAYEIALYVKPFVSYQQELETAINVCTTVKEVQAISINYDAVAIKREVVS